MSPLKNAKHEAFAHGVASGLSAIAAYRRVAQKPDTGGSYEMASRWSKKVEIRERVRGLQERSAGIAVLTCQRRRELLARRAESPDIRDAALVAVLHLDAKLAGELVEKTEAVEALPKESIEDLRARIAAAIEREREEARFEAAG